MPQNGVTEWCYITYYGVYSQLSFCCVSGCQFFPRTPNCLPCKQTAVMTLSAGLAVIGRHLNVPNCTEHKLLPFHLHPFQSPTFRQIFSTLPSCHGNRILLTGVKTCYLLIFCATSIHLISTRGFQSGLFLLFPHQNFARISLLPHNSHTPRPFLCY